MHIRELDAAQWAQRTFGECQLGDTRRTRRLVDVATRMASHLGSALCKSCDGDTAALLGGYRLMRNPKVRPGAISEGGFAATVQQAQGCELMLALEDTTTLSYRHCVASKLGPTSNAARGRSRGYLVDSVLLVDAVQECTLGLLEQRHWVRKQSEHGKKYQRNKRAYRSKESYKWERSARRMSKRMGEKMSQTITVCDREADVYEYLSYKLRHAQRFVVRARANRAVVGSELKLFEQLEQRSEELCCYTVKVEQRGGRPARLARVSLSSAQLSLCAAQGHKGEPLKVNVVLAEELQAPAGVEALRWVLLSTEAVDSAAAALQLVRYYECRWLIEEYHKAWKSGIGVERQRYQSPANLARSLVLTAFLAVRLLQLREAYGGSIPTAEAEPSVTLMAEDEWKVLWASTQPGKALPSAAPSARWCFMALAKLGGFADTKRTGCPSWQTLWEGWFRLQERLLGYKTMQLIKQ